MLRKSSRMDGAFKAVLMIDSNKKLPTEVVTDDKNIKRRTFISFSVFAGLNVAAFGAWKWLRNAPEETPGISAKAQQPLRNAFNSTEAVFRKVYSPKNLVKTYPKSAAAKVVRKNGIIGLESPLDRAGWRLQVTKKSGKLLQVTLNELRILPKTELIYDFKCVEGWEQVQHWGGVTFADFMKHYKLEAEAAMQYAGLETPDKKYYVGMDMESAMHPQTLLAYEMNGQPLNVVHGAPLRLIVPVKYGIKNLKRIGTIHFSNQRPRDYWAEQGYDYYSGL